MMGPRNSRGNYDFTKLVTWGDYDPRPALRWNAVLLVAAYALFVGSVIGFVWLKV